MSETNYTPRCPKCTHELNPFECASIVAIAKLRQHPAIIKCECCETKVEIQAVTHYEVKKIID